MLRLWGAACVSKGLPVIIIVLVFEVFAVITIIKPNNGWAFSLIEKEQKDGVQHMVSRPVDERWPRTSKVSEGSVQAA